MRRIQNVLLAGAACLLTVATAQAADLPLKAKPIQYVKVCSLYGAGFYFIPGTDICLKVGGYLRAEADVNAGGTLTSAVGPGSVNNRDNINNRESSSFVQRSRSLWTLDTRQQRRGMFWPSEIEQLQDLCKGSEVSGAFSIDTVPTFGVVHADICAINFGALYCSCGAVLTQGLPLYEV